MSTDFNGGAGNGLLATIARAWPPAIWQDVVTLVGVSGGADSVALMLALATLRPPNPSGRLVVAHFDHGLRPDSASDEQFVRQLAESLGLPYDTARAGPRAGGGAAEQAAREARYDFFTAAANAHGARYLALAHTRDDQAETIMHRILRGTGLRGLSGIPATRRLTELTTIVRPLLDVSREQILEFLACREQPWREDSTNTSLDFTRNRIRHELLPMLRERYNPRIDAALIQLAEQAAAAQQTVEGEALTIAEAAVVSADQRGVTLRCPPLRQAGQTLAREAMRLSWRQQGWPEQDMDQSDWDRLYLATLQPVSPFELPGAIRVEPSGNDHLCLRAPQDCAANSRKARP
ncbi:MAG: tRNA lysidine(34) synthetase TilS [Planctomycetales bacterium]|nr:tRNA lysidine(34) synthetase TilS [Planctomycetales bacterium]